ncbi:DUF4905 domain-containing protein [Mucilaginibacter sp. RS28]|uniref:DUF4905 domain-containing protein n=1 Tax=Mucilaginibacter straminoryzae TaxID=2932774 RepID=A0A9X1X3J8_9SPHI|nr:DUF4905 domain-containing protein [Mucilaginibacter straminoryzae]MCJ8209630.1 DUF4905 domain-containing protein [Mucilaginibacter straminoryzae]
MSIAETIAVNFSSPIWRMQIDESEDLLFVEVRNTAEKQVSFSGLDLKTGAITFKDLVMPERWLTGMEAATGGVLLLHGFQSEKLPLHKGLTALDGRTGEILWADYNLNYDSHTTKSFIVYDARFQPKKTFQIHPLTGERLADSESDDQINSEIKLPEIVDANLISLPLPVAPHGNAIHYLRHNEFEIVSLHALNNGRFNQYLYVFNGEKQVVYQDIVNEEIQKLQPEAFISYKNQLIWLKNQHSLKVVNL